LLLLWQARQIRITLFIEEGMKIEHNPE